MQKGCKCIKYLDDGGNRKGELKKAQNIQKIQNI